MHSAPLNPSVRLPQFLLVGALMFGAPAWAQFSGTYAPGNWTSNTVALGCGSSAVNTGGAPASVALTSANNCADSDASFVFAVAPQSGTVSFSWAFAVTGGTQAVGYTVNGIPTQVAAGAGSGGPVTFAVTAGQPFGFYLDKSAGFGVGTYTVSNFSFTPTVVASTMPWPWMVAFAALLGGVGARQMRRRA